MGCLAIRQIEHDYVDVTPAPALGRFTGLSRPTVARIPSVPGYVTTTDTIEVLCRCFKCTPCELMVLVDEPDGRKSDGHSRKTKKK